jgi:uncharacterized protein
LKVANVSNPALGIGWSFPPEFSLTDGISLVADAEDIRQSLILLLSTVPGERIMHPTFGCGLKHLVFESITEGLLTKIRDLVSRSILLFEARIILENIVFDMDDVMEGLLKIELIYQIRATQNRYNLVFPFYLESDVIKYE